MKPFIKGFEKLVGFAFVYKLVWEVDSVDWTDSGGYEIRIIAEGTRHSFILYLHPTLLGVTDKDGKGLDGFHVERENYLTRDRFTAFLKANFKGVIDSRFGL